MSKRRPAAAEPTAAPRRRPALIRLAAAAWLTACLLALPICVPAQGPAAGTARWFYERALVFSVDQKQRVDAELRQAIQADPNLAEPRYFLGKLLLERSNYDGAVAELRAALKTAPDHLPARLALAAALHKKQYLKEVVAELEPALGALGRRSIDLEVARIKSVLAGKDADKSRKLLAGQTEDLLRWIDETIKETPQHYQKLTTERGLRDAVVLLEVAELYAEDEDSAPELLPKFLQSAVELRGGFFPVALVQYGALLQPREPRIALDAYERGVAQMQALGLREGVDYDLAAVHELRRALNAAKKDQR